MSVSLYPHCCFIVIFNNTDLSNGALQHPLKEFVDTNVTIHCLPEVFTGKPHALIMDETVQVHLRFNRESRVIEVIYIRGELNETPTK